MTIENALVTDITRSRARVVVQAYLWGGDVRNAFVVLAQSIGDDVTTAFDLVKEAAEEMGVDGAAVNGAAVMG